MDVSAITSLLADVVTAITTIGTALLLIWGTKLAYRKITGG
jgi:hypothetical protein